MLIHFLDKVESNNKPEYKNLLFNLYEESIQYTMEAVYDDDVLIIGRDEEVIIGDKNTSWETILKTTGLELKRFFKKHKEAFTNIESVSYGFVDGDLYEIKKAGRKKSVHFTKEDFYGFDGAKLNAWLAVYLKEDAKKKYCEKRWETDFTQLSKEEFQKWCGILAGNFDYSKYGSN